jgi:HK97 family phage major capsid protein
VPAAKKQLRVAKHGGPLFALVNPIDYYKMKYTKDDSKNYTFQAPSLTPAGMALEADGVSILEHTAVTAGDFFVFTPKAATIFDRTGTTVRFYDQDQDNAINNLITVVIEKRLALAVYYQTGIIKSTFSAAITDLTS